MAYLTLDEFLDLGFDEIDSNAFEKLLKRASSSIDLFINFFYDQVNFETDFEPRKRAVKHAVAHQIAYLDSSGIMSAEDKTSLASMTIGRTSVSYQNGSQGASRGRQYNLSLDALNWLEQAGFGARMVNYDR
ncbi:head-tail connector protein [Streptococcus sp. 10F2]